MKKTFLFILSLIVLVAVSFFVTSTILSGNIVSKIPEASDFCATWGRTSCQQAGEISENWKLELDLIENGVQVKKSCLDVMECNSCSGCGFV